jgi:hypothetical protein
LTRTPRLLVWSLWTQAANTANTRVIVGKCYEVLATTKAKQLRLGVAGSLYIGVHLDTKGICHGSLSRTTYYSASLFGIFV